jgi:hypothetical protein
MFARPHVPGSLQHHDQPVFTMPVRSVEQMRRKLHAQTKKMPGLEGSPSSSASGVAPAWLFRLLRNARGAGRPHSLGPVATAGRPLASVENTTASPSRTGRTGSLGGARQSGRQRPWPLAPCQEQSALCGAIQCLLQIARSPVPVRSALAQLLEPPWYGPVCQVVWGGAARLPPIPMNNDRNQPTKNVSHGLAR